MLFEGRFDGSVASYPSNLLTNRGVLLRVKKGSTTGNVELRAPRSGGELDTVQDGYGRARYLERVEIEGNREQLVRAPVDDVSGIDITCARAAFDECLALTARQVEDLDGGVVPTGADCEQHRRGSREHVGIAVTLLPSAPIRCRQSFRLTPVRRHAPQTGGQVWCVDDRSIVPQLPPRAPRMSAIWMGAPPVTAIFINRFRLANPNHWLSGEKNGWLAGAESSM